MPTGTKCVKLGFVLLILLSLWENIVSLPKVGQGLGWVEVIRKVYEVDPLRCPACGGQMRIISFIEETKTIDRIIRHLELNFEAERPPPPCVVQQYLLIAVEEKGKYF
jgi:hypothetical protein